MHDVQQKSCIFKGLLNLMLTMNYYMPINNLNFKLDMIYISL